jgi:hypothetical protein
VVGAVACALSWLVADSLPDSRQVRDPGDSTHVFLCTPVRCSPQKTQKNSFIGALTNINGVCRIKHASTGVFSAVYSDTAVSAVLTPTDPPVETLWGF